jgi:hypothetical protein
VAGALFAEKNEGREDGCGAKNRQNKTKRNSVSGMAEKSLK